VSAASIEEQVRNILADDDRLSRLQGMAALRDTVPLEARDVLIGLLTDPDERTRGRAGSLLALFSETVGDRAEELANLLRHSEDPSVRLGCAILLSAVEHPAGTAACIHALTDPFDKVAIVACDEVGERGGAQGAAALLEILDRPEWRVRIQACMALITLKSADPRLVTTLEALSQEPEVAVYDREDEEFNRVAREAGLADEEGLTWGPVASILAQARQLARPTASN
jgi:HEAT repeat protein